MPMLIEHIDAIARKKQRDVLYVTFHPRKTSNTDQWDRPSYDWEQDPIRETVCKWLTEHHCVFRSKQGAIPSLIGLTALKEFVVCGNQLTGTILSLS